MQARILRTVDANINRVSEGLRVLEDVSRFILEDEDATRRLKSMRHQINHLARDLGIHLLLSRDAEGDIGADSDLVKEHGDLYSIVRANAKRAQEGLRVLEELIKLPELKMMPEADEIRKSRYLIYTIEVSLISQLSYDKKGKARD
ncbi:MAG: thiamine-phosphate pyrophosphorylase [Dehalococcoidia bacterium]|nr:thiamine-phosphate pyrophosphorylase [Dehalococcoidia bacterium]